MSSKKLLRQKILSARSSIGAEHRAEFSSIACLRAESLIVENVQSDGATIGLYKPIGSELDIAHLVLAMQVRTYKLAFPVVQDAQNLEFFTFEGQTYKEIIDGLPHPMKALSEISGEFLGKICKPEDLSAIVVPGVAFSSDGYRLGYGKGYYDRYLSRTRDDCFKLGIAYSLQLVDNLPTEAHDYKLDSIVTEIGLI